MRPFPGEGASEPARCLELAAVPAHSRNQHSFSSSTDTSSTPVGLVARSHRKPNPGRRLANFGSLFRLCLTVSFPLVLFVILFFAIPAIAKSSSIDVPVQPTAENITQWLDDFAVVPVMCHSHNDYLRPLPLISALMAGCTGVEADVWLTEDGQDLLVGHDRAALTPQKSLRTMYLDPLLDILDSRNSNDTLGGRRAEDQTLGVFKYRSPAPLILMIDVKEDAAAIWAIVLEQLEPFRQKGYLRRYQNGTISPGPLVVVGSGGLRLDTLLASSKEVPYYDYHDTFLDAPLGELSEDSTLRWTQTYNTSNSYYASVSFKKAFGSARPGFNEKQLDILRRQIYATQSSGLYSRYWGTPERPIKYRDYLWHVLRREGVGILSVDDVDSAAKHLLDNELSQRY